MQAVRSLGFPSDVVARCVESLDLLLLLLRTKGRLLALVAVSLRKFRGVFESSVCAVGLVWLWERLLQVCVVRVVILEIELLLSAR